MYAGGGVHGCARARVWVCAGAGDFVVRVAAQRYGKVLEQIKSKKGFGPDGERFVYTDFIIAAQSVVNATVAALTLLMTQSGVTL